MNRYLVKINMSHDELTAFLAKGIAGKVEIEALPVSPGVSLHSIPHPAAPKPRAVRGSKVNDAILGALADGPQSAKTLKAALEKAGLAGGSLSTGLALLQKAHRVERSADGSYALTMQKAAE
jgi:hypothetical protein